MFFSGRGRKNINQKLVQTYQNGQPHQLLNISQGSTRPVGLRAPESAGERREAPVRVCVSRYVWDYGQTEKEEDVQGRWLVVR